LHTIDAIFQSTEKATLERVFQEQTDRLAPCCVAAGGFVEGTEKYEDDPGFFDQF
jgi:hypothetical protein